MLQTAAKQILYRSPAGASLLRLAGVKPKNDLGRVPYRSFLALEFRRLSEPDDTPPVDRCHAFSDLFHLSSSPAGSRAHRRCASASPMLCHGPVRRSSHRHYAAGPLLPRRSRSILLELLQVARLGRIASPRPGDAGPSPGLCLGKRMAGRTNQAMAGISLDGPPSCVDGASAAKTFWNLEWTFLHRIPADPANPGSGLHHAHTRSAHSMHFPVSRPYSVDLPPWEARTRKEKKIGAVSPANKNLNFIIPVQNTRYSGETVKKLFTFMERAHTYPYVPFPVSLHTQNLISGIYLFADCLSTRH